MNALSITARAFALPARLTFTFILLAYPAYLGFTGASPWSILVLGAVFVMADVFGKWRLYDFKTPGAFAAFVAKGYPVQIIVCGVIYLIARGLGSMMGRALADNAMINWPSMGIYAAVIAVTGLLLIRLERGKPTAADLITDEIMARMDDKMEETHGARPTWDVSAPTARITVETLYDGHHYSNYDNLYKNEGEDKKLKASAILSEEDIAREEARLGITLPDTLRALYLKQNGGHVGDDVWSGDADNPRDEDINPFSGYFDLTPLTSVDSLKTRTEAFTSIEDEPDYFPNGSDRMMVLAQWYQETLFLDYRSEGAPRVGFYNFDDDRGDLSMGAWEADCRWWPDFDAFFATLYRQKRELA